MPKIISKRSLGIQKVYDIGLPVHHNFVLANGTVASNCFNKAHSVAYALLGYWTAYLKTHYTVEFQTALINSEVMNSNDIEARSTYIKDTIKQGIKVVRPSASCPSYECTVLDEHTITLGMGVIKGVSEATGNHICENAPYTSVLDFFFKVSPSIIRSNVATVLAQSGFFDCFIPRWRLLPILDTLRGYVISVKGMGVLSLDTLSQTFGTNPDDVMDGFVRDAEFTIDPKALMSYEINAFGFCLALALVKPLDLSSFLNISTDISSCQTVLGTLGTVKTILTKKGQQMGFAQLIVDGQSYECVIFPNVYKMCGHYLNEGEQYFFQCSSKENSLILNSIEPLYSVLQTLGFSVIVDYNSRYLHDIIGGTEWDLWLRAKGTQFVVATTTKYPISDLLFLLALLDAPYEIRIVG
jgi:DNA polymerase-3 subunit alpha